MICAIRPLIVVYVFVYMCYIDDVLCTNLNKVLFCVYRLIPFLLELYMCVHLQNKMSTVHSYLLVHSHVRYS